MAESSSSSSEDENPNEAYNAYQRARYHARMEDPEFLAQRATIARVSLFITF